MHPSQPCIRVALQVLLPDRLRPRLLPLPVVCRGSHLLDPPEEHPGEAGALPRGIPLGHLWYALRPPPTQLSLKVTPTPPQIPGGGGNSAREN